MRIDPIKRGSPGSCGFSLSFIPRLSRALAPDPTPPRISAGTNNYSNIPTMHYLTVSARQLLHLGHHERAVLTGRDRVRPSTVLRFGFDSYEQVYCSLY
jgi:hypothetical protein